MPLFSVIIPSYNSSKTLRLLLESLQSQTFSDFEVIIVDDASTDDTQSVAGAFPVRYERMPVNAGPATARNRGAELSSGDWLVFTDADTVFLPDTLERIARLIRISHCDALVGSYAGKPANSGFVPRYKALWEYCMIDLLLTPNEQGLQEYTTWAPRPGVVNRDAFNRVNGFNTVFRGADLEDMDFGYRLVKAGFKVFIAPEVRIWHHYPATMRAELVPFARRAAIWMRMAAYGQQFDSQGESSARQAFAHLTGFLAIGCLMLALFLPAAIILCGLLGAAYVAMNGRFFGEAFREGGVQFLIPCVLYCWLHSVVLGVAAAYGLLTARKGH